MFYNRFAVFVRSQYRVIFLACLWLFGLVLGFYISAAGSESSVYLMRTAVLRSVSIVGLLVVLIFPFVISAVLIHYVSAKCIYPLAFLKAIFFAFCLHSITLAFGSSSWLVRWILMFSESCMVVILLWFWIRNISGSGRSYIGEITVFAVFSAIIFFIDFYAVSPFLKMLF